MTKKEIEQILVPGVYKGTGMYEPTKKFPNGIVTTNKLKIENDKRFDLKITNEIRAYDQKTKKKLYQGKRKTILYEDSNDVSKYVYESKSYINNNIVSSQYGNISSMNTESKTLTIKFLYSYWFITNVVYNNSYLKISRDPQVEKLTMVFKHAENKKGEKPKIKFKEEYFQQ